MNKLKLLRVQTTQGYAGELARESQYVFNYGVKETNCEIGLTMPMTARSHAANILPGPIRQNLPEGFLLGWIQENFGKTMPMNNFNMVALPGRRTIGRVRCGVNEVETQEDIAGENLTELLAWKGTEALFAHLSAKYAAVSGVSGVQPKVLISEKRDAHLKNFGMLYEQPRSDDARLSPLYDVVNTSAYLPKDAMALTLNKTKNWPDRETLINFGRVHCEVVQPAEIIDQIVEAAASYRPSIESGLIWDRVRIEIERGCISLRSGRVLIRGADLTAPQATSEAKVVPTKC